MKEDKELRKKLKSAFETPDTPFEEWAEKRRIFSENTEKVDCPVLTTADNVNGRGMSSFNKKKIYIIGASFVALIVAVVIILCFVLPKPLSPKIYGDKDALETEIELSEVEAVENIYLFDTSTTLLDGVRVTRHTLKSDESNVFLYALYDCILSVQNAYGNGYDGFYITYRVRTYKYYDFYGLSEYKTLNSEVFVNNFKIKYNIEGIDNKTAYASFSVGGYDYFIEAHGYEEFTSLEEDNFINLLNEILI